MTSQGVNTKTKAHSFFPDWVRQRELRHRLPLGHSDSLYKSLYTSLSPFHSWDGGKTSKIALGGVFSLEFSPDGTHLVAGSVKNGLRIFDPLSRRLIHTVQKVHAGYVSHVKFLDSRIFATGGDDGKVFLWDTRNLKSRIRTLTGHSSSIANIEFSRKNELLITSALDGIIHTWDTKNWTQKEECNNSTIMSHVLLCLRINADETKMIISTESGYLLIVHQLDLNTFVHDLVEFGLRTSVFTYTPLSIFTSSHNRCCFLSSNRRRNRMEMVTDFPNAGDIKVIPALEIHPQGWSAFSRCVSEASGQEWTCVHDIQEKEPCVDGADPREGSGGQGSPFSLKKGARKRRSTSPIDTARARAFSPGPSSAPPHPLEPAGLKSNPAANRVVDLLSPGSSSSVASFNRRVLQRFPRLTHYIEEPNSIDLCIESLGVSADGRLICSPLERGIRLLAFSPECSEQSVSWCGTKPRLLYELGTHTSHDDNVICSKFSPRHSPMLVSGCLDGKLAWYQPVV